MTKQPASAAERRLAKLRGIVEACTAARIDGVTVDLFSASMCVQIADKLSPANRADFTARDVRVMIGLAYSLLNKVGA